MLRSLQGEVLELLDLVWHVRMGYAKTSDNRDIHGLLPGHEVTGNVETSMDVAAAALQQAIDDLTPQIRERAAMVVAELAIRKRKNIGGCHETPAS